MRVIRENSYVLDFPQKFIFSLFKGHVRKRYDLCSVKRWGWGGLNTFAKGIDSCRPVQPDMSRNFSPS